MPRQHLKQRRLKRESSATRFSVSAFLTVFTIEDRLTVSKAKSDTSPMLKVFTTEALWEIVNHAFQIHGGAAYFTDLPLERMLRHARINQIGEGANEVLTSFIALVGMRGPGVEPREIWVTLHHPSSDFGKHGALASAAPEPRCARRRCRCKAPRPSHSRNSLRA